jgi:hypothetical protein
MKNLLVSLDTGRATFFRRDGSFSPVPGADLHIGANSYLHYWVDVKHIRQGWLLFNNSKSSGESELQILFAVVVVN